MKSWEELSAGTPRTAPGYHTGVRPRDAASLLLVRFDDNAPRVLMGARHGGHRFMPHKVVFPGGRVDRADLAFATACSLHPETERLLVAATRHGLDPRRARALALAAIRETFEETGLLIGAAAQGRPPRSRAPSWRAFLDHGVLPDPAKLHLIARAITPPGQVRRFDTRFFLTDARAIAAATSPPSDELLGSTWLTFEEARASDLPTITRAILDLAEERLPGLASGSVGGGVPMFHVRHGRRTIDWLRPPA